MSKRPICVKPVSNNCRAIECDLCLKWCHLKCSFLTLKHYNAISVTNDLWICQFCCHNVFPFRDLDTSELLELTFNSNTECYCSSSIDFARLENLPQFDFIKALANGFNICFNIHSILLNAVERLLNDVERWDGQTVSTFHSTKLSEWLGN